MFVSVSVFVFVSVFEFEYVFVSVLEGIFSGSVGGVRNGRHAAR